VQAGVDQTAFVGPIELATLLAGSEEVSDCMALQFHRYAQGRTDEASDTCAVVAHQEAFREAGGNLVDMLIAFIHTDSFRYRRAADTQGEP
jgi:hypothetical protein